MDDPHDPHSTYFRNRCWRFVQDEVPISKNTGTPYPCSQEDLDGFRRHGEHGRRHVRFISQRSAVREITHFLNPERPMSESATAAVQRLKENMKLLDWAPDIIIKAFNDLDRAFFNRRLKRNVGLRWMTAWELLARDPQYGRIQDLPYASTKVGRKGVADITMNADLIFKTMDKSPWKKMWGTLLHEMIHAYLHILCGDPPFYDNDRDEDAAEYDDPHHGIYFQVIFRRLNRRTWELLQVEAGE